MLKLLPVAFAVVLGLHGLIHLMGFVAYWPLAEVPDLAYKTAFLDGRIEFGIAGTRLFSVLWLLAAIGFVGAAVALVAGQDWWVPLLVAVTLLSLVITALDWTPAFRGTVISAVILLIVLVGPSVSRWLPQVSN